MIPLRDNIPTRRFPIITVLLIVVNSLIFLLESVIGTAAAEDLIYQFGFVPARITSQWMNPAVLLTLFTSMYLHGGWFHLISNMLYLWIFGNNIEDNMGRLRFLVFYTLCGVLAATAQIAVAPNSEMPGVGASGAIAGVLGAYLLLYPQARIRTLVLLPFWFVTVNLPAMIVLGSWFLTQFFNGLASLNVQMQVGGVAWWAHIGGFVTGLVLVLMFRREEPPDGYGPDRYESYYHRGRGRPGDYW
ncbi:MAG: rhomboid family intramembrane serine protease [Chloroflexi bacterium]|jgi:membrane associated rhomboid family serine protease|nr:rhomboid family intramembrane serine protease [Chloroflexota bacterium]